MSKTKKSSKRPRPSREDVETLCLLLTVGPNGCATAQLTDRLGLSPGLLSAVGAAAQKLEGSGWLSIEDGQISLTTDGEEYLAERLSVFGVAPLPRSAA